MERIKIQQPDGNDQSFLLNAGEIRFGPAFYTLTIDGKLIEGRLFGKNFIQDAQLNLLAIQEFITLDIKAGPVTALTLFKLADRQSAQISRAQKGYIHPLRFESDLVVFQKIFPSAGKKAEYEIRRSKINNWISDKPFTR